MSPPDAASPHATTLRSAVIAAKAKSLARTAMTPSSSAANSVIRLEPGAPHVTAVRISGGGAAGGKGGGGEVGGDGGDGGGGGVCGGPPLGSGGGEAWTQTPPTKAPGGGGGGRGSKS